MATFDEATQALSKLSDEDLQKIQFAMPWQYYSSDPDYRDPDNFPIKNTKETEERTSLQEECWEKFNKNPQFNTSVRGLVGRLTGKDFCISSEVREIQEFLDEFEYDPRNRLYHFWPKYVGRAFIEGELFLCLTVNNKKFVECDFIDPSLIKGIGDNKDGIYFHPFKTLLPILYTIKTADSYIQIPSIYVAHYPDLLDLAKGAKVFNEEYFKGSRTSKLDSLENINRYIVAWDRSFITKRNSSYLRTTIEWLNHYENLKKYEIDHKKSSGAYLWIIKITDAKAFRLWLAMDDADKRKTGIMAKKTPGGTLVLPPGMDLEVKNPTLPKISDTDTDILHMITSGLNEPEDVSTGQSKGTFASVKASRGPMSDRISDEVAYFERFLKFDFYKSVFFLKSKISDFPEFFKIREAVDFNKGGKPKFEMVKKRPEFLINVSFPISEVIDAEARARAYLGVKHGSTNDTLGIPNSVIANKLGLGDNYKKLRLQHATEEENYPELISTLDQESVQEKKEAEPQKKTLVKRNKEVK